jgi:hypothetical protein
LSVALGGGTLAWPSQTSNSPTQGRGLLLFVDKRLGTSVRTIEERIVSSAEMNPLLAALANGQPILHLNTSASEEQVTAQLAYNHVILIGLADDAILKQAWQNEAVVSSGSLYVFGFGNMRGSLGYIESDRNPFLHAGNIPKAPYECQAITITGTDIAGIEAAVDAFVTRGLVNGIVARGHEWSRPSATLLDRDPLADSFKLPVTVPANLGNLGRIGLTQAGENEYRGVLADTGKLPISIWRAKYFERGQWDGAGAISSFHNYSVGLHRRAYGNTVWVAEFADSATASHAAPLLAAATRMQDGGSRWKGTIAAYSSGSAADGDALQNGTLEMWVDGVSVVIASKSAGL